MPNALILTRATTRISPVDLPPDLTLCAIDRPTDAGFSYLDQFYTAQKFPSGWTSTMLDRGGQAIVLLAGEKPVASSWLVRKPMYVQEIKRIFDAGPDADYYMGDFVAPDCRGRGLQRLLIRARLHLSHAAGRWAIALTHGDLAASLDNYRTEGFEVAAELHMRKFLAWNIHRLHRLRPDLPAGKVLRARK